MSKVPQIAKFHWLHEGPTCVPLMGHTWAATNGHTGACNNFPRGTHVFFLSKYPHGTHMKPICVCHLYCPCWANVWLPIIGPHVGYHYWGTLGYATIFHVGPMCFASQNTHMGTTCVTCHLYCPYWAHVWLPFMRPMWAATNWAHYIVQQFSTWGPCVLPLKVPTCNQCLFTICVAHVRSVCDYLLWGQCELPLVGFCVLPLEHLHHTWWKESAQLGSNIRVLGTLWDPKWSPTVLN